MTRRFTCRAPPVATGSPLHFKSKQWNVIGLGSSGTDAVSTPEDD